MYAPGLKIYVVFCRGWGTAKKGKYDGKQLKRYREAWEKRKKNCLQQAWAETKQRILLEPDSSWAVCECREERTQVKSPSCGFHSPWRINIHAGVESQAHEGPAEHSVVGSFSKWETRHKPQIIALAVPFLPLRRKGALVRGGSSVTSVQKEERKTTRVTSWDLK